MLEFLLGKHLQQSQLRRWLRWNFRRARSGNCCCWTAWTWAGKIHVMDDVFVPANHPDSWSSLSSRNICNCCRSTTLVIPHFPKETPHGIWRTRNLKWSRGSLHRTLVALVPPELHHKPRWRKMGCWDACCSIQRKIRYVFLGCPPGTWVVHSDSIKGGFNMFQMSQKWPIVKLTLDQKFRRKSMEIPWDTDPSGALWKTWPTHCLENQKKRRPLRITALKQKWYTWRIKSSCHSLII